MTLVPSAARIVAPIVRGVACLVAAIIAAGCTPAPLHLAPPQSAAPTAEEFTKAQSERIAGLASLALRGHAEIRWRDDSGSHFDDGDFDLLVKPPASISVRISKIGEKILWVGGGDGQWWIVYPRERPSRALLRPWVLNAGTGRERASDDAQGLSRLLDPTRLLETLALCPVEAHDIRSISWDAVRGGWVIALQSREILARGESLLPVGCTWFDADHRVIAECVLEGFEWVRGEPLARRAAETTQPLVATRITISVWTGGRSSIDQRADGVCTLAAEVPSYGADRIRPQLFNWTDVQAALRPELVEDERK